MSNQPGTIVVGADGSQQSIGALRWAAQQARLTQASLHVITGYLVVAEMYPSPTFTAMDFEKDAQATVDFTIHEAFKDDPAGVPITTATVPNKPAVALTEAAKELAADLLVVGSHGHGIVLAGWHLGSVAGYCVHHAPCPVVVYRQREN